MEFVVATSYTLFYSIRTYFNRPITAWLATTIPVTNQNYHNQEHNKESDSYLQIQVDSYH